VSRLLSSLICIFVHSAYIYIYSNACRHNQSSHSTIQWRQLLCTLSQLRLGPLADFAPNLFLDLIFWHRSSRLSKLIQGTNNNIYCKISLHWGSAYRIINSCITAILLYHQRTRHQRPLWSTMRMLSSKQLESITHNHWQIFVK